MDNRGSIRKFGVLTMIMVLAMAMSVMAFTNTTDTSNTVTVSGTCSAVNNATTLAFGSLAPGDTSGEEIVNVSNSVASLTTNVSISGTEWGDSGIDDSFVVSATKYDVSTGTYASKTALSGTPTIYITNLPVGGFNLTFLQVQIPGAQAAGSYVQNMTFTADC